MTGYQTIHGASIHICTGATARLRGIECHHMGHSMSPCIQSESGATLLIDGCSSWLSYSSSVVATSPMIDDIDTSILIRNSVFFWSIGSMLKILGREDCLSNAICLESNCIVAPLPAARSVCWNSNEYPLIPLCVDDFHMVAGCWIEQPTTICRDNIICCAPSPVVAIWSHIRWDQEEVTKHTQLCIQPSQSYLYNDCYNLEGFWGELFTEEVGFGVFNCNVLTEDYHLLIRQYIPSKKRQNLNGPRWVVDKKSITRSYDLGKMDWSDVLICSQQTSIYSFYTVCDPRYQRIQHQRFLKGETQIRVQLRIEDFIN